MSVSERVGFTLRPDSKDSAMNEFIAFSLHHVSRDLENSYIWTSIQN